MPSICAECPWFLGIYAEYSIMLPPTSLDTTDSSRQYSEVSCQYNVFDDLRAVGRSLLRELLSLRAY